MKLLFDQNLSPRLPRVLADIYPESVHVREINMRDATDTQGSQRVKSGVEQFKSNEDSGSHLYVCFSVAMTQTF